MDTSVYAAEAKVVEAHWWFLGRQTLFSREIEKMGVSRDAAVLDVGTSTGANLEMARKAGFADIMGLDFSAVSQQWCAERGLPPVRIGDVCNMPFADNQFDLVLATDIIEHVDDDEKALREIERVLKPGGKCLITVPAFRLMWSRHDETAHHKRRYLMKELVNKTVGAGLDVSHRYYFNFLLFVPIWLARKAVAFLGMKFDSDTEINSPVINWILHQVFKIDVLMAPWLNAPFGVSALVVAKSRH